VAARTASLLCSAAWSARTAQMKIFPHSLKNGESAPASANFLQIVGIKQIYTEN
jgi:hypothetical protein